MTTKEKILNGKTLTPDEIKLLIDDQVNDIITIDIDTKHRAILKTDDRFFSIYYDSNFNFKKIEEF